MQDRSHPPTPPEAPTSHGAGSGSAERRELFADFVSAGELERRRVAESIHDDSIQVIAAMGMRLQMLRRAVADPDQLGLLTEAERAVQLSIARLRHLAYGLHPPGLEQEGLAVALALALDRTERDAGIEYRLDDQYTSRPAMPQSAILFRIAQEALANVREHAGASSVTVTLLERDDGHAVRIADDGHGFQTALEPPEAEGYGFVSMRARVRLGGGSLRVESAPGTGTTVEAWLPRWQAGDTEAAPV
jgi:signal transduction histidine kinase